LLPARRAIRELANNKAVSQPPGHRSQLRFTNAGSKIWRLRESRSTTNPLDPVQGVRQFTAGTVDFGASDKPMQAEAIAKVSRGVVQVPMTAGAIAVAYHHPGCELKLTREQLAGIFLGTIRDYKRIGLPTQSNQGGASLRWLWHHSQLHQAPLSHQSGMEHTRSGRK
jgi:hypothetical protein